TTRIATRIDVATTTTAARAQHAQRECGSEQQARREAQNRFDVIASHGNSFQPASSKPSQLRANRVPALLNARLTLRQAFPKAPHTAAAGLGPRPRATGRCCATAGLGPA